MDKKEAKVTLPSAPNGAPAVPGEPNPECERYGHNTKIQAGGLCFLICCFPCSVIYFMARKKVQCIRCGMRVPPQGIID